MGKAEKYIEGLPMDQFTPLEEISWYNFNYFVGLDRDLLFAKSDDDNVTEWWLINGHESIYLGESYCSENDILHRYDKPNT